MRSSKALKILKDRDQEIASLSEMIKEEQKKNIELENTIKEFEKIKNQYDILKSNNENEKKLIEEEKNKINNIIQEKDDLKTKYAVLVTNHNNLESNYKDLLVY